MSQGPYFFDTHALFFWVMKLTVSSRFIEFFDAENDRGNLYVPSLCFWELALLVKKGRVIIKNITQWKQELIREANLQIVDATVDDMIRSTLLPDYHRDPFDRLLIAQTIAKQGILVSKDTLMKQYSVKTTWIN